MFFAIETVIAIFGYPYCIAMETNSNACQMSVCHLVCRTKSSHDSFSCFLFCMPMEAWTVSTGPVDFVGGFDKKLRVGFGLFENCNSLFGTQGAVFGSECFDHTDGVALPNDATG